MVGVFVVEFVMLILFKLLFGSWSFVFLREFFLIKVVFKVEIFDVRLIRGFGFLFYKSDIILLDKMLKVLD